MLFTAQYIQETIAILQNWDLNLIEQMVEQLRATRERSGRLFVLGVGGSAANASHAVNDFRKLAGIDAYAPTDNVSELTARTNDDGWETVFVSWLHISRLQAQDTLLILSVGGGNVEKNISANLVHALKYGKKVGATILGIVSRDGGYTAQVADVCLIVPTLDPARITPHAEASQAILWHLFVSHPRLANATTTGDVVCEKTSNV